MNRISPELVNCPHCGEKNPVIEDLCAGCGKPLLVYIGPRPKVRTFRLADGMGWIAITAVCLGVGRIEPCFGIAIALLIFPSFLRTTLTIAERKLDSRPLSFHETHAAFWASLGVTLVIEVAAVIPLVLFGGLIPFSIHHASPAMAIGILGMSALASVLSAGYVARSVWPRRD